MPSCERCRDLALIRHRECGGELSDHYNDVLREAEEQKQPCTQNTPLGQRLRAGQFWDDERQIDRRLEPQPAAKEET